MLRVSICFLNKGRFLVQAFYLKPGEEVPKMAIVKIPRGIIFLI
jgi:hypothetical protein